MTLGEIGWNDPIILAATYWKKYQQNVIFLLINISISFNPYNFISQNYPTKVQNDFITSTRDTS